MSKYKKLTPEEERVIVNKGTEAPFSGEYDQHFCVNSISLEFAPID